MNVRGVEGVGLSRDRLCMEQEKMCARNPNIEAHGGS